MKRKHEVTLAPMCAILCVLSSLGCRYASDGTHSSQRSFSSDEGYRLYTTYCRSCHGEDGTNDRNGAYLNMSLRHGASLSATEWWNIVRQGRGDMPAFQTRLTEAQARKIQAYIAQQTHR